ncbi:response regulator transcription factor [Mediterraneibacter glycyrrhizinilyticus]|uniref:response regulator transcription factor n=1 Tax=Mediterraneibacter glycyrrhizinilyticus TaxID=342942 RepID=UPI002658F611|nr:response regulator transcription factor [Mediterraneibacter glycyrrhizinilyticus]MCF2568850.1 response regulator transcription factor [Mediterraneibacter glycyrrhizinilyticus]
MSRLLLLEDDLSLIDGLKYSLEKNGFELDVARSVTEARKYLSAGHGYDLLLLDVTLPDGTGFMICEERRALNDMTPIIFLTAADEETSIIRGLDCGGDDYITKPFKLGELCSRIRALLRRSALQSSPYTGVIRSGPVTIDQTAAKAYLSGEYLDLTGAEYRLLCLFIRHAGQTLTRNLILDELWDGQGNFVDDNTLSVYIRRLREKIEEQPSRPEHLLTVRGMGYRWEGED